MLFVIPVSENLITFDPLKGPKSRITVKISKRVIIGGNYHFGVGDISVLN